MKAIVKNWYNIAVYIALAVTVVLALGEWSETQRILLASLAVIHLHFFEEFQFPWGFPLVGMTVEIRNFDHDPNTWDLNNASSFWGNEWFAVMVYLLPLLVPQVRFLTLAAVLFAFVELLMHDVVFPACLKRLYNPGLVSAALFLTPLSIAYFCLCDYSYLWYDWPLAPTWIVVNYWMAFRSPIYRYFGSMKAYTFPEEQLEKGRKFLK